jgi:type I restriction enzyme, S subunit
MKTDYKIVKLGDVAEVKGGKRLPIGESLVSSQTKHPYIRITDIVGNRIKKEQLLFVTDEVFSSISKYIVTTGDIILSIVGSIGFVAKIDDGLDGASLTENCLKIINLQNLDADFLFYFLISKLGQEEIAKNTVGAVQKKLPIYGVQNIEIALPSFAEQKSIATVLSSFDDKIELLQEQNKTLEEMAQRLFKEWFVDFKFPGTDGKPYKASGGKMVASEQGQLPQGWKLQLIGEMLDLSYGKALKAEERTGSGYPVYGSNGPVGLHESYLVRGPGIIVGRKGTMGSVIWCDNNFSPIDTAFFVRGKYDLSELYYYYFLLKQQDLTRLGSDSAVPGLNRQAVHQTQIAAPPKELIESFNRIVKPLFEKRRNNLSQINELTNLRDTLLPRLMCGDLTVKTS